MPIRDDRIVSYPSSVAVKAPCRVATTVAITLTALQTVDGTALADGDRVLVRAQDSTINNGIYVARASDWERAKDCDGSRDLARGTIVNVYGGATQSGWWECLASDPIVVGTSALTWSRWLLTAG